MSWNLEHRWIYKIQPSLLGVQFMELLAMVRCRLFREQKIARLSKGYFALEVRLIQVVDYHL